MRVAGGLRLVLVEPAGPLNVGSVARLCANFGVEELRLVAPRCDPLCEEARRMAVRAVPLLERARSYLDLPSALADCRRVVAATGRQEGAPLPLETPEQALAWLAGGHGGAALVFGREDRGLSNDELLQAGRLLRIGTDPTYPSLNLSHAVAVALQTLHGLGHGVSAQASTGPTFANNGADPAARKELEATLADAQALLLEVGFLHPHTANARMAKVRALLQRAQVDSAEVALLRGMVAQVRWASRRGASTVGSPMPSLEP